jgi:predicted Zn-dependent protease
MSAWVGCMNTDNNTATLTSALSHNMVMVLVNHSLLMQGVRHASTLHEKYVAKVEAARLSTTPQDFSKAEIEADAFFAYLRESELLAAHTADIKEALNDLK